MDLVIQSPDELLAAVPHVLGFKPEESIVLVPFGRGLPIIRVDLPKTARDREEVWDALRDGISQHARMGTRVGIVCITEDPRNAELASQHLVQPTGDDRRHSRTCGCGATESAGASSTPVRPGCRPRRRPTESPRRRS